MATREPHKCLPRGFRVFSWVSANLIVPHKTRGCVAGCSNRIVWDIDDKIHFVGRYEMDSLGKVNSCGQQEINTLVKLMFQPF